MRMAQETYESSRIILVMFLIINLKQNIVDSKCPSSGTSQIWAYGNPSIVDFTDSYEENFLSTNRGAECRWLLKASYESFKVRLTVKNIKLKYSSGSQTGDCLNIYDGPTSAGKSLEVLCGHMMKTYTSSGREMLVVYTRGEQEGDRSFSMEISADTNEDSFAKTGLVIGIVVGVILFFSLIYFGCKYTHCCRCLKAKTHRDEAARPRRENGESDHLTTVVTTDERNNSGQTTSATFTNTNNSNSVDGAQATTSANSEDEIGESEHSDSDSLEEMNEPPPSYASLYLDGDEIPPPKYTPPKHRARHPPRRVQTFN